MEGDGTRMINSVNFCPVCGHPLDAGSQFCSMCRRTTVPPAGRREAGMHLFSGAVARVNEYRMESAIVGIALLVLIVLVLGLAGLL
jgi:predicted nucleic acid-binding Zn ribbon protein